MFYKNQKSVKKSGAHRGERFFSIILAALIAVSSSPLPVWAAEISEIHPEFLEGNVLTAEIEKLSEVKPELAKTHDEERKDKIQIARDDSEKWTERMVLGKMQRGSTVEDVLGKRKDAEKVVADLKEAGALATFADEITGKEKEINPNLKKNSDNAEILETEGTPYAVEISKKSAEPIVLAENSEAAGNIVSAMESDKQVAEDATPEVREEIRYFNWNANEVEGSHEENKILYRDLWESTDLLVTAGEMGVKEDIILKNSFAPTEFNYIVETIGLKLQTTDDGGFVFVDSTGEEKFYTPAPNITDAEGKFAESGVHYELGWKKQLADSSLQSVEKKIEIDPTLAEIKFDEGEGEIAKVEDSENEGKISGAEWFENGIRGSALLFDGEDDLVEIPRDFEIPQQLTFSAFVRSSAYQNSQILGIGRHSLYQDSEKGWKAMFRVNDKNLSVAWDTSALYLEQWYFLTATFDGEKIRIFVDGEEENYLAAEGNLTSNDELILIGGGNGNFAGVIDEVQIFNRALSAAEIKNLFDSYSETDEEEIEEASENIEDEIEVVEITEIGEDEIEVIEEDAVEKLLEKLDELKEQVVFPEEDLESGEELAADSSQSADGEDLEIEEVSGTDDEKVESGEIPEGEIPVEEIVEESGADSVEEVEEVESEIKNENEEISETEIKSEEDGLESGKLNVESGEVPEEDEENIETETPNKEGEETSFFNLLKTFFLPAANAEEDFQQIEKFDENISIEEIIESNESVESEREENLESGGELAVDSSQLAEEEDLESGEESAVDSLPVFVPLSGTTVDEQSADGENLEIEEISETDEVEIGSAEEKNSELKTKNEEELAETEEKTVEENEEGLESGEVSEEDEEIPEAGITEEEVEGGEILEGEIPMEEISAENEADSVEEESEVVEQSEVEKFFAPEKHEEIVEAFEEEIEVIEESEVEKFFVPEKHEEVEIVIAESVELGEIVVLSEQEAFAQSNLIFEEVVESDGTILRRYKLRLVIDVEEFAASSLPAFAEASSFVPTSEDKTADGQLAEDEVGKEIESEQISKETIEEVNEEVESEEDLESGELKVESGEVSEEDEEIPEVEISDEESLEIENMEGSEGESEEVDEEAVGEKEIEIEIIEEEEVEASHEAASEEVVEVTESVESGEVIEGTSDEVVEEAEEIIEEIPIEIEAENLSADVLQLADSSSQLAEEIIELSPTLTLVNGTVLTYPLDLDPTTFIRLVNRGARTFAPNFEDGNQHGENSQTNNPGRINRGTESFLPSEGLAGYWKLDGNYSDSSGNENNGTGFGFSGAVSSVANETNAAITVADVDWMADEWANETFTLVSGNGAPATMTIVSNTADTLTLSDVFTAEPEAADLFTVTTDSLINPSGRFGSAAEFDGTDDYVDVGSTEQTAKAVSFWIFADDDSGGIVDFDGGVHSIETAAGMVVATGFDASTIYVDGSEKETQDIASVQTGAWHHISITTATGFDVSALKIGMIPDVETPDVETPDVETPESGVFTFFNGKIDDFAIYSRELSGEEVAAIYNGGRTSAANPQITAIDTNGDEFLGNATGNSRDWLAADDSLQTNSVGSKIRFETNRATEIWAGFTCSPAAGIVRATIDGGTNFEVVNEIDMFAETIQTEQKILLATGLRNSEHTVELELLAKKNPRQSDSVDSSNFLFDLDYFETHASQFELAGASIASTADTGTPTTLFDSALTQSDDFWNGAALTFTSGDNNGETVFVTDFDGDTGKLTFFPAVGTTVSEETFQLTPDGILIGERATRGIAATSSNSQNPEFETLGNLPTTADGKTKKGSFSIWVSPDFDSDADTDKHFIFDSGLQRLYYDGVGDKFHFEIWNPSTSSGQAADWETVDVESASQDFSAYENFHLAAGWDADSGVKLFVNGIKTAKSTLWMAQPLSAGDKQFTVGKCGKKSAGNIDESSTYFSGTLAEPQIWNYVLLDSEIFEIFNSTIPSVGQAHTQKVESINFKVQSLLFNAPLVGTPNDRAGTLAGSAKLDSITVGEVATIAAMDGRESNWIENERVGFWKLDGNYSDASGNENTGAWNDVDESGQSFPTGQFNNAAEFDGVDDYVDVGLTGQTA
ncbi:MAG: LamG domain-containing protein, partial [Patescibacteria group bacterium]